MAAGGILPSFGDFETIFSEGKSQFVWQWVPADLETPVSAYLKLTRDKPYSFLLESVEGGAMIGRYSAIGFAPDLIWQYQNNTVSLQDDEGNTRVDPTEPLTSLRRIVGESRIDHIASDIPPMRPSGLFGFMGYGMVKLIENIPDENPDELNIPESVMIRPRVLVVFDNVQSRLCLITPVRDHAQNTKKTAKDSYESALRILESTLENLYNPIPSTELYHQTALQTPLPVQSNMPEKDFHAMVERAAEYIRAGDIFQVVLGQRFSMPFDLPPFALYRSLRRLNPSPFLFFFNFGAYALVGSSPEILVRVRQGIVTLRPIAGTRKRGANAAEDKALAEDLLADPKERAEHLMLLDLGRNDVGRVAKIGTVQATDQFTIERYSHVMHIVSNVEGVLRDDLDSLDALFAGFPAGTVTGAPKVRAMEIIDELEPLRRSYYAGCVGYLDGNGELDTCIALRTALVKDGKVYVQASGGIVADSTPDFEYQESVNKARALIAAADEAVSLARQAMTQKQF